LLETVSKTRMHANRFRKLFERKVSLKTILILSNLHVNLIKPCTIGLQHKTRLEQYFTDRYLQDC